MKNILAQLDSLRQGILCGIYKHKSASPWADLRTEKIQVSGASFLIKTWIKRWPAAMRSQQKRPPTSEARTHKPDLEPTENAYSLNRALSVLGSQNFFLSTCRARSRLWRSSKLLSLISYSHILENRWKQKARCFPVSKITNPTKNKTKTAQEDTQGTRWDTTLSEKKSSGRSVLLHDVIANLANRCPKWLKVSKL